MVEERKALKERYEREGRKNVVHDKLGKNWITQFCDRHSELAAKLAVRMDKQRVYANDYTTIKDYTKKLGKVLAEHNIKDYNISNVDEKGIILGYSAKTKVITQRGRKNPYVKQDGKHEMLTLVEAVSANGFLFPTFLITKGKVHTYGQYGNVKEDDKNVRFGKSPKGWTDEKLGYYWLTEIYNPCSLENAWRLGRVDDKWLLILDGHSSHVNLQFSEFCDRHNIICFCLPAHSTHLLQPLDVGLFGPLQRHDGKAVENYHNTTNIGISHCNCLPLYKEARVKAYTEQNIKSAFWKTGIVPFLP